MQSPDIMAELFVEVLGALANLYIPEFDFLELVRKHCLLDFLATYAQPGVVDDDILLEVVMFVGVLCNEGTAPLLVSSGLVRARLPGLACLRVLCCVLLAEHPAGVVYQNPPDDGPSTGLMSRPGDKSRAPTCLPQLNKHMCARCSGMYICGDRHQPVFLLSNPIIKMSTLTPAL